MNNTLNFNFITHYHTYRPYVFLCVLALTLFLFIWNRWRYDVVAAIALISCLLLKLLPFSQAFTGFSNPAVITVGCVMVISQALTETGLVSRLVNALTPVTKHTTTHVGVIALIAGTLSAFMNNVGALALMMPVTLQTAMNSKRSPSLILMPLAFASVLGGLVTAIGTPPNLLISAYRESITGHPFQLFDYTPVGLGVALAGAFFITFIGWRLLPTRRKAMQRTEDMFEIQDYITEVCVPEDSPFVDRSVRELEALKDINIQIVGLIRGKQRRWVLPPTERITTHDLLIVETSHDDLQQFIAQGKLTLIGEQERTTQSLRDDEVGLIEAVIPPGSRLDGRMPNQIRFRSHHQLNLLAIARHGRTLKQRLTKTKLTSGDVLLLQGNSNTLQESIVNLGLLPLVDRGVRVSVKTKAFIPFVIFALAIVASTLRLLPIAIAFSTAVLLLVLSQSINIRTAYKSVDWSVILLLAAMIPVGQALQSTGGTALIADLFVRFSGDFPAYVTLGLLMLITMTLSDVMNNAATAVLMAPIAASVGQALQASIDPFLMAVAIGASCSFLTPIAHQNNVIVMGPGGYRFSDYMRLGVFTELIVIIVALPLLMWVWPLH